MIKNIALGLTLSLFSAAPLFAQQVNTSSSDAYAVIPKPLMLQAGQGMFVINPQTKITLGSSDPGLKTAAEYLRNLLGGSAGFKPGYGKAAKNYIRLSLDAGITNAEGYTLSVKSDAIEIKAKTPTGAFWALQTLRQLLPAEIESKSLVKQNWTVPAVEIKDEPRFAYRGMMLDVSRHFYTVEEVKSFIDVLALQKVNTFHWHLTDDQGWRIEIKKYPRFTEVGGKRDKTLIGHYNDMPHQYDNKPYGPFFYTQDEIKDVIRYASERFINIVPEIDLPGHASAALAAYPEMSYAKGPFKPQALWGIFEEVYAPKPEMFKIMEDVLTEVVDLFPGKYIHIGGDEVLKKEWEDSPETQAFMKDKGIKDEHELQSYIVQYFERFIRSKGKEIIGWDEILEGGLSKTATIMSWTGLQGGIAAAKQGNHAIMTPTSHLYFNYYQSTSATEPLAIGGLIPLEKVYEYEPIPAELPKEFHHNIIGTQGNIWTEYITTNKLLQYMALPREAALAEMAWLPKEQKNYDDFVLRLGKLFKRFDAMGLNYSTHVYDITAEMADKTDNTIAVKLSTKNPNATIHYTQDGSEPTVQSATYGQAALRIAQSGALKAINVENGKTTGDQYQQDFLIHKAIGKKVEMIGTPSESYNPGNPSFLVNGIEGNAKYNDNQWFGFNGENMEAVIDLGEVQPINQLGANILRLPGVWIHGPKVLSFLVSDDKENWKLAFNQDTFDETGINKSRSPQLTDVKGRYVKVVAENLGVIPKGNPGEGNKAFMFIDEVIVNGPTAVGRL